MSTFLELKAHRRSLSDAELERLTALDLDDWFSLPVTERRDTTYHGVDFDRWAWEERGKREVMDRLVREARKRAGYRD